MWVLELHSRLYQLATSTFALIHTCFTSLIQGADPSLADFGIETILSFLIVLVILVWILFRVCRCVCRESKRAVTHSSFACSCRVYCSPLQSLNHFLNESVDPLVKLFRNIRSALAKTRSGRLWIHHYAEQERTIKPQFISLPQFPNHSGISLGQGVRFSLVVWDLSAKFMTYFLNCRVFPAQHVSSDLGWSHSKLGPLFFSVKACHDFLALAQDFLYLVPSFWCGPVSLFPYSPCQWDFGCVVLFGSFSFFKRKPPWPG